MRTNLKRPDFVLIEHLQATWHRALRANVDPRLAVEREKRCFSLICQVDPTECQYHGWLAAWRRRRWGKRGFGAPVDGRDLFELNEALRHFHAIRDELPPDRRDIGLYRTIADLRGLIPTGMAQSERRREKDALKARAMADSIVHFREKEWMVVSLHSFVAGRFWGLGTRWCTVSSEATYLNYARGGEMVVFITPRGRYQLATRDQIFREDGDGPVPRDAFRGAPEGFLAQLKRYRGPLQR